MGIGRSFSPKASTTSDGERELASGNPRPQQPVESRGLFGRAPGATRAMRWGTFVIVAAAVSCNAISHRGPLASRWPVQQVLLFCDPTALNFDGRPGVDGFRAQILAFNLTRGREKALWLDEGELEIFLYDGAVVESDRGLVKPLQTWTVSADELLGLGALSNFGVIHSLALRWKSPGPSRSKITIAARYRSGLGEVVDSSLVTISNG